MNYSQSPAGGRRPLRAVRRVATFLFSALLLVTGCAGGSASNGEAPSGALIAFEAATGIHVVRADGSGLRRLTSYAALYPPMPAWSPDGTEIAFNELGREPCECHIDVYVMRADGSGRRRLTRDGFNSAPAWSPDGKRIAFEGTSAIWVVAPDGAGLTRLTPRARTAVHGAPTWSPDGRHIAFSTIGGGIYVMTADGRGLRQLVTFGGTGHPVWSPGGGRIVFDRPVPGGCRCRDDIYSVRVDGSGLRRLSHGRLRSFWPDWSSNGTAITFVGSCDSRSGGYDGRLAIHVMAPDGSSARRITPCWPTASSPVWSPDGKRIAFMGAPACFTDDCRERALYVTAAEGSALRRVAGGRNLTLESDLAWQPTPR